MQNQITVEVNERASSYLILKSSNLTTGFLFISSELSPASVQQRSTPKSTIGKLEVHCVNQLKVINIFWLWWTVNLDGLKLGH